MDNHLRISYAMGFASTTKYTIDINDKKLYSVESWFPHVGNEGDQYVSETIELRISAKDRAIIYKCRQELEFAIQQAKLSWEQSAAFPVYLEVLLPDMTAYRRTRLVDGRIEIADSALDLDNLGNGWLLCRLVITRLNWFEGPYKALNIYGANQISATVVEVSNRSDNSSTTAHNGIKILGTDLEGDLPGLARVHLWQTAQNALGIELFRGNPIKDFDNGYINGGGYGSIMNEGESFMGSSIADSLSSDGHYGSTSVGATYTSVLTLSNNMGVSGFKPGWYAIYFRHPGAGIPYTGWRIKGSVYMTNSSTTIVQDCLATFESDVSGFQRVCSFFLPTLKYTQAGYRYISLILEAKITPSGGSYLLDTIYVVPLEDVFYAKASPGMDLGSMTARETMDFGDNEFWRPNAEATWDTAYDFSQYPIRIGGPISLVPSVNNYIYSFLLPGEESETASSLDLSAVWHIGVGYRPRYRTL